MDLAISLAGEVLLIVALGLDLRRLRRQGDRRGDLEPFRIWFLRVYFFSVLALPFYFWRTRGRARWALVGIASAILYIALLEGAAGLLLGCSSTSSPARPDGRGTHARVAGDASADEADGGRAPVRDADVEAALAKLRGKRFPAVLAARDALLHAATPRVVAGLVELARSSERVPLEETSDLVYPGSRRFDGHGLVAPYDLDRLGARAGWVLEALTFRDFGFSRAPHPDVTEPAERPDAAERAASWWRQQDGRFVRVDVLAAALRAADGVRPDAVLDFVGARPLDAALRAALHGRIVPALVEGLGGRDAAHRRLCCQVARLLVLRELSRDAPRWREALDRHLAGDATLAAALRTTLSPEISFEVEVPGAGEILAPAYSMRARDALEDLIGRLVYANGVDHVGVAVTAQAITIYAGDSTREAAAWRAWLAR